MRKIIAIGTLILVPLLAGCPSRGGGFQHPGAPCKASQVGKRASTIDGDTLVCTKNHTGNRAHWETVNG